MNTEEAVTRLAEDGINHNIEEAVSQRIEVHGNTNRNQRSDQLQENMSKTLRSSRNKKTNIVQATESNEFANKDLDDDFKRHNDFRASLESDPLGDLPAGGMIREDHNAYNFYLSQERYLEGLDTRCILQFDNEKFVACVWGQSEIYVIDREKPDAVNSFETNPNAGPSCKQNLSI